jgi:hypothetical protein
MECVLKILSHKGLRVNAEKYTFFADRVAEVTIRSWYQARRSDVGASEAGEAASRDPTHKVRRCEVGGLTLYSRDQLSKRNIFQISKLVLFSDAQVSRRNILFARDIPIHINHVINFM